LCVDRSALRRRRVSEKQELAAIAAERSGFGGDARIFAALPGRRGLELSRATAGAGAGDLGAQLGAVRSFADGGRNGDEAQRDPGDDRQYDPPGSVSG